ncbi:MAG: hypothetical protein K0U36_05540, partial [Alphaproteobacteria bacterium]|nr:hypothetical protein [Alphaproteobacteria bacterium]
SAFVLRVKQGTEYLDASGTAQTVTEDALLVLRDDAITIDPTKTYQAVEVPDVSIAIADIPSFAVDVDAVFLSTQPLTYRAEYNGEALPLNSLHDLLLDASYEAGNHVFTIFAEEGDATFSQSFTVAIVEEAPADQAISGGGTTLTVTDAPGGTQLVEIDLPFAEGDGQLRYVVTGTTDDGTAIAGSAFSYNVYDEVLYLSYGSNGLFTVTATDEDITDADSATVVIDYGVDASVPQVITPDLPALAQREEADVTSSLADYFVGTGLEFTHSTNAPSGGFVFDNATQELTVSYAALADGPHTLTITATDDDGDLVRFRYSVTVVEALPIMVEEASRVEFVVGDKEFGTQIVNSLAQASGWFSGGILPLTYSLEVSDSFDASHASIDPADGIIALASHVLDEGTYTFTVHATDSLGASSSDMTSVVVTITLESDTTPQGKAAGLLETSFSLPTDSPATIDIADSLFDAAFGNGEFTYAMSSLTADQANFGLSSDGTTFSIEDAAAAVGTHTITFAATDADGDAGSVSVTVTVEADSDPYLSVARSATEITVDGTAQVFDLAGFVAGGNGDLSYELGAVSELAADSFVLDGGMLTLANPDGVQTYFADQGVLLVSVTATDADDDSTVVTLSLRDSGVAVVTLPLVTFGKVNGSDVSVNASGAFAGVGTVSYAHDSVTASINGSVITVPASSTPGIVSLVVTANDNAGTSADSTDDTSATVALYYVVQPTAQPLLVAYGAETTFGGDDKSNFVFDVPTLFANVGNNTTYSITNLDGSTATFASLGTDRKVTVTVDADTTDGEQAGIYLDDPVRQYIITATKVDETSSITVSFDIDPPPTVVTPGTEATELAGETLDGNAISIAYADGDDRITGNTFAAANGVDLRIEAYTPPEAGSGNPGSGEGPGDGTGNGPGNKSGANTPGEWAFARYPIMTGDGDDTVEGNVFSSTANVTTVSVALGAGNDSFVSNSVRAGAAIMSITLEGDEGNDVFTGNTFEALDTVAEIVVSLGDGQDTFGANTFTLTGGAEDGTGIGQVRIYGGAGNDTFTENALLSGSSPAVVDRYLLDAGEGTDTYEISGTILYSPTSTVIDIDGTDTTVTMVNGALLKDFEFVNYIDIGGFVPIGVDSIVLAGVSVDHEPGARVSTTLDSFLTGFTIAEDGGVLTLLAGEDIFRDGKITGDSYSIDTGDDKDRIIANKFKGDGLRVVFGGGTDVFSSNTIAGDDAAIYAGINNDTITDNTISGDTVEINGGRNNDTIADNTISGDNFKINGDEHDDSIIDNTLSGVDSYIYAGANNDYIAGNILLGTNSTIDGGSGNDTFGWNTVGSSFGGGLVDGGSGNDTLTLGAGDYLLSGDYAGTSTVTDWINEIPAPQMVIAGIENIGHEGHFFATDSATRYTRLIFSPTASVDTSLSTKSTANDLVILAQLEAVPNGGVFVKTNDGDDMVLSVTYVASEAAAPSLVVIDTGEGSDEVAGAYFEFLHSASAWALIATGAGDDTVVDTSLDGRGGYLDITLGDGDDRVEGLDFGAGEARLSIHGGDGNDTLKAVNILGDDTSVTLDAGIGINTIQSVTLAGEHGSLHILHGGGTDTISRIEASGASSSLTISMNDGAATVESVTLSGESSQGYLAFGAVGQLVQGISLTGNESTLSITTGAGADTITDISLSGNTSSLTVESGTGADLFENITLSGFRGSLLLDGGSEDDTFRNIELTGNSASLTIDGGDGTLDTVYFKNNQNQYLLSTNAEGDVTVNHNAQTILLKNVEFTGYNDAAAVSLDPTAIPALLQIENITASQGFAYLPHQYSYANKSTTTGLGEHLGSLGDINGDGYDDILVGSSYFPQVSGVNAGSAYDGRAFVFWGGQDFTTLPNNIFALSPDQGFVIDNLSNEDRNYSLGLGVSAAGDLDGDGYSEIVVAAGNGETFVIWGKASKDFGTPTEPDDPDSPRVFDVAGISADGANTDGFSMMGDNSYYFSRGISTDADLNGDGYDDIVFGSVAATTGTIITAKGASYVVWGSGDRSDFSAEINFDNLPEARGFRIDGLSARGGFG